MKKIYLITVCICFAFLSTAQKRVKQKYTFEEDLSIYRVKINLLKEDISSPSEEELDSITNKFVSNSLNVRAKLDTLLEKIRDEQKTMKMTRGYMIIAYSGLDRDKANEVFDYLESNIEDEVRLIYEQPNYKVKVGGYLTKLDAYSMCVSIRKMYPLAIIINDNIVINLKEYVSD